MRRFTTLAILAAAALVSGAAIRQGQESEWTSTFDVDRADFASTGRNPYFILEPGHRTVLEHGADRLVISVLPDTRTIDGVETRVVEERETHAGALVEISRNFYAISKRTNSVFYFGEEVDTYTNGRVSGHEGSWTSGVNGAHFGLMMPGLPLLHARYYQELAPKTAMDRAEIATLTYAVTTPAGAFTALRVRETTPLEPGHVEWKAYAAGVGLVEDGDLKLSRTAAK